MTRILIVDDATLDREIAGGCVREEGGEPIFASSGAEALEAVRERNPALVLTDLQMPGMDGLELVETMKSEFPETPVILMTAFGSEEIAVKALRAGAASYVPKRNLKQDLGEAVRAVMASVNAVNERRRVRGFLQQSQSTFILGYEEAAIQALVSFLQDGLDRLGFCDRGELMQVGTALAEALQNAVDHGNLELDSALRESTDRSYRELGRKRALEEPYRDRRVHVTSTLTPTEARYTVRDEGPGFDPSDLPDPTDPENLLKPSGRGIMLISTFMNEVKFNERGNEITMIKRRPEE